MDEKENLIPRKIWTLWFQGVSEAPFIVKECIDSWVRNNPTWDVVVLDSSNINNYIQLDMPEEILENVCLANQADLIRLLLLSKYGGVWCDATTFCTRPLDNWIDDYTESGFFAFEKPGVDRVLSSWFIASKKGSPVCTKLYNKLRSYFIKNNFNKPNRLQRKVKHILSRILNRSHKTTKYWFNPIITKLLNVSPYFAFHYMFERLVSTDPESKAIWQSTKKLSADSPHLIQTIGLFSLPSESIKKTVNDNETPLYKLTWKFDNDRYSSNTLLHYVLEKSRRQEI